MAVSIADCWHRSKLNCGASVSISSSVFDEEESQEGIRQTDLKETPLMCAYRDRPGEPQLSKIISLALFSLNLPLAD
jgi:hypothetical protein